MIANRRYAKMIANRRYAKMTKEKRYDKKEKESNRVWGKGTIKTKERMKEEWMKEMGTVERKEREEEKSKERNKPM